MVPGCAGADAFNQPLRFTCQNRSVYTSTRLKKSKKLAMPPPPAVDGSASADAQHVQAAAPVPILYGSQTGTCVHLARLISASLHTPSFILPVDAFELRRANSCPLIIFVVATHGDGQCPFNMARLWDLLAGPHGRLFRFRFAVLAVGSSTFERYNWCGRVLSERLTEFGAAQSLCSLANTQDPGSVYDGLQGFLAGLPGALEAAQLPTNVISLDTLLATPYGYRKDAVRLITAPKEYKRHSPLYAATLVRIEVVARPDHGTPIYELVFDIPDYKEFLPGDCLGILPQNAPEHLQRAAAAGSVAHTVDLRAPPRQPLFYMLAAQAQLPEFKNKLQEIARDCDLYLDYVAQPRRTPFEVLDDFGIAPTAKIIAALEPLYTRYYSCARIDGRYHVLLRDVDYKTSLRVPRRGLCCEYLKQLAPGACLQVEIARSRLFLDAPRLLFLCTGTGVTLPRSVLHSCANRGIRIYQGFRQYGKDQICADEMAQCAKEHRSVEIIPAASVDDGKRITAAYRENPVTDIDEWLVFVSGNTRVNKDVRAVLQAVHGKEVVFQSETW